MTGLLWFGFICQLTALLWTIFHEKDSLNSVLNNYALVSLWLYFITKG